MTADLWYILNMKQSDNRKLSPEVQQGLREKVALLYDDGRTNKEISDITGVTPPSVSKILKKYREGGLDALRLKLRGRKTGEQRSLTIEQEHGIKKLLIYATPDKLGLPFFLWTNDAIRSVVQKEFDIKLPRHTLCDYLMRWGFTFPKPSKRDKNQINNKRSYGSWVGDYYKSFDNGKLKVHRSIVDRAKLEKAEINWMSFTSIWIESEKLKILAINGKELQSGVSSVKVEINMISTLTNQGKIRFKLFLKTITNKMLKDFILLLKKDIEGNIFIMLKDGTSPNITEITANNLKQNYEIELFYV